MLEPALEENAQLVRLLLHLPLEQYLPCLPHRLQHSQ